MTPLRLTRLGDFVSRHSVYVLVSPFWWQRLWKEVNRRAEHNEDWESALHEIEHGAREMRERFYQLNNPAMPETVLGEARPSLPAPHSRRSANANDQSSSSSSSPETP